VGADHRAQVEEMLAGYRRSREQLGAVQRKLATLRASATSEDGLVTVTVGPQGQLHELVIVDSAYRKLRPHELAATIVALSEAASAAMSRAAGEALAPVLPADTDPEALLRGTADLTQAELKPEPPDAEETFENVTWMQAGGRKR
jgi:DNA-binding protein YbaB